MNPSEDPTPQENHLSTKTVVIVLVIVLLIAAGVLAYVVMSNKKTEPVATTTTTTTTSTTDELSSGTSDTDIQKDLDNTSVDNLDSDLDKVEKDINTL